MRRLWVILILAMLLLAGCDEFGQEVKTAIYADPNFDLTTYRRFMLYYPDEGQASDQKISVPPLGVFTAVASELTKKGYTQVTSREESDFIVFVLAMNEYKEQYVPTTVIPMPRFVPGQTITTYGSGSGYIGSTPFFGSGTSTTYSSGYWTTQPYVVPGHYRGAYYPFISISFIDTKVLMTKEEVKQTWEGRGIKMSHYSDITVDAPSIIRAILKSVPDVHAALKPQ